jgi:hypothetical protein
LGFRSAAHGIVEERLVRIDPYLLAVAASESILALAEENGLGRLVGIESFGQLARCRGGLAQPIHHARAIRGRDDDAVVVAEASLKLDVTIDVGLPVVRAEHDCVALEELVRTARRVEQRTDRRIAAFQRFVRPVRTMQVRGEVVVR